MRNLFLFLALCGGPAAAATIEGRWKTEDGKAIVTIAPCGAAVCGRTSKVLASGPGVPVTDIRNPDPKLRGRPILGLPVLTGFTRDGNVWKGGRAYDPKSGKSYRATLQLNPDGSLKVTGCVLVICKSRRWTRVH